MTNTSITPSYSGIKYFNTSLLKAETGSFIIKVKNLNDSCLCTLLSVQHPSCPEKTNLGSAMR